MHKRLTTRKKVALAVATLALVAAALAGSSIGAVTRANSGGTVMTKTTALGRILVDSRGHSLYLFEKDKGSRSACYAACAKFWPPLLTSGKPVAGPAFTVRVRPGDNLMIHKALELASPGDVIVVDGGGDLTNALFGEIMTRIC